MIDGDCDCDDGDDDDDDGGDDDGDDDVLQNRSKLGGESNKEENTDTSDSLGKKSSLFADTSVPQKCKGYFQPYLLPHPEELGEFPWCIGFTIFLQTKDITEVKYHLHGEEKKKKLKE